MTIIPLDESVPDEGHENPSDEAVDFEVNRQLADAEARADAEVEAEMQAAAAAARFTAESAEKAKRDPVYTVYEMRTVLPAVQESAGVDGSAVWSPVYEGNGEALHAWVEIADGIHAATDRKAIDAVIGTHESPKEGFNAKRRLGDFWAPLSVNVLPRKKKRTVTEGWG